MDLAVRSRPRRDELLRAFRGAPYAYDLVMDVGAYRDLHRHRRCQQFRQAYSSGLGYDTPDVLRDAGVSDLYDVTMRQTFAAIAALPPLGAPYLIPFGSRPRFLFSMNFATPAYIARL